MATKQLGAAPTGANETATVAYAQSVSGASYSTTVGDGTNGPFVVTHNLGTTFVSVSVFATASPRNRIVAYWEPTTTNTVTLYPAENWTAGQYSVVVHVEGQSDTTAPTAPTLSYVSKTATSITVSYTGATDNVAVVGYYRYLNGVRQNITPDSSTVYSGLTPSTTYNLTVTAVDNNGNESVASNTVTQTTNFSADTVPPTAPTLSYVSATETSITVSVTGATDNVGVTGYNFYLGGVKTSDSPLTSGTTYTFTGLTVNTNYSMIATALDATGNESAASNTVTHTTPDLTAPTAPTLTLTAHSPTSLSVSVTGATDNVGVVGRNFYLNGVKNNTSIVVGSTYTYNGLTPSTSYNLTATALDAAGNESVASNTVTQSTDVSGLSYIDSHAEKTSSSLTTMPTHATNDLLLMFAYRDGFNTAPTVPSGWTAITSGGANSNGGVVAWKVAGSSTEVSGAWTNCTNLECMTYRGASAPGAAANNNGSGTAVGVPALTLQVGTGSSWVIVLVGDRSGNVSLNIAPGGSGLTARASYVGNSNTQDIASFDTNGGVSTWAGTTINTTVTGGWWSAAVELKAA